MRLAGYQPQYFPRLHYFARALNSDIFALSDNVQFVRSHVYVGDDGKRWRGPSYQAHTLIKSSSGIQRLAVHTGHAGLKPINQTLLDIEHEWPKNHAKGIYLNYARAPHGPTVSEHAAAILSDSYRSLAELNIRTFIWALAWILGDRPAALTHTVDSVNTLLQHSSLFRLKKIIVKSAAGIAPSGNQHDATDVIVATCAQLGADEYYAGGTARAAYLDETRLKRAGIRLVEQEWILYPYRQQFPKVSFIPNLSIIDLLANEEVQTVQQMFAS